MIAFLGQPPGVGRQTIEDAGTGLFLPRPAQRVLQLPGNLCFAGGERFQAGCHAQQVARGFLSVVDVWSGIVSGFGQCGLPALLHLRNKQLGHPLGIRRGHDPLDAVTGFQRGEPATLFQPRHAGEDLRALLSGGNQRPAVKHRRDPEVAADDDEWNVRWLAWVHASVRSMLIAPVSAKNPLTCEYAL